MKEVGAADRHEVGGRLQYERRIRTSRFGDGAGDAAVSKPERCLGNSAQFTPRPHNQFNQERHIVTRQIYKQRRSAALAEWRALAAEIVI